jgi:uncharacterized protein (TIGR03437 family)
MLLLSLCGSLAAAPKLRLSSSAIGPYSIAVGANGAAQTAEAWNAGDGSLSLQVSSSVPWAVPTTGAARPCVARVGACLPVQVAFQTASLAPGMYTGTVTVGDPNAIDAPQTIAVTVQIGGGVPDRLELYVAPNGSAAAKMTTNQYVSVSVATQDGRPWLAVASEGGGSFKFGVTYTVNAAQQSGMDAGDYRGSIAIANSDFAPDNKTVDVRLHVTEQPIAGASPSSLAFRIAQHAPRQTQNLVIANRGLGALEVSGVKAATTSGGSWLSAGGPGAVVAIAADPSGMDPGVYQGSLEVTTNAVNGALTIPVRLEVVPQSPPLAFYRGTVNAATFLPDDPIAQGDIMALFGEQLAYDGPQPATAIPLPTRLGNTRVLVNGQAVPLYYSSYGQINFQMPFETPLGEALVRVERDGQAGNAVSAQVSSRGPRILPFGEYGVIQNYTQGNKLPMPPTPDVPSARARAGDILVIYAFGLGATSPAIPTGDSAPAAGPLPWITVPATVHFGPRTMFDEGVPVIPDYAGLTPTLVGVYQLNVRIPEDAPRGDRVALWMRTGDGSDISNTVLIAIE